MINIDPVKTGQNMKKYRKRKGLKVREVSKKLGLQCTQAVYKWERGDCMPHIDTFLALCYLYGVQPLELCVFYDNEYAKRLCNMFSAKLEEG